MHRAVLLAAAAAAAAAAAPRARVLVWKSLTGQPGGAAGGGGVEAQFFVVGRPMTVTYSVFNVGEAPATDVSLEDEWPADSFDILAGAPRRAWPALAPCVESCAKLRETGRNGRSGGLEIAHARHRHRPAPPRPRAAAPTRR